MMNGEAAATKLKKMMHKHVGKTSLRVSGSLIVLVTFLWICRSVLGPNRYSISGSCAMHIGVATIFFGLLFLLMGLPILASLFVNLSGQLQAIDEACHCQGLSELKYEEARETKTLQCVLAQLLASMITMCALLWGISNGFKMATETRRYSKYYSLTISIGVLTVIFGLLYLIIGLGIIAKLALDLANQVQHKEKEGNTCSQGSTPLVKCYV